MSSKFHEKPCLRVKLHGERIEENPYLPSGCCKQVHTYNKDVTSKYECIYIYLYRKSFVRCLKWSPSVYTALPGSYVPGTVLQFVLIH